MDEIDRAILNEIQSDFPITRRPFQILGEQFHLTEQEVLERLKKLKGDGIIRRIGGNLDSRRLNFTSTLCAARVPEEKIDGFIASVNRFPGVTHNYLRNHNYNVWFTFIAPNMATIQNALRKIREETEIDDILNLPAVKTFKIRVDFEV